ncbi:MAG TPA: neutral/alkaline non-lysosomal ceramidase N-terminal domain-containing protein [archaeon]|nr:neutral/alkaline non-lysosomal ceramidase N-terminal domain-containing protein [archaeon]
MEVHDSLYLRIVCLDDGTSQFFLISTDISGFPLSYFDDFCTKLKTQTGIEPEQVIWASTHTHSGPGVGRETNGKYSEWLKEAAIKAVKEARASLAPAKLGYTSSIALANMNRRALYPDSVYLGKNPEGPMDRQLGIIKIEKADGSPMALIANYAMHGTALYATNQKISGDAPGIVASYVEKKFGAPMLYINGAAGNLGPLYDTRHDFIEDNHFNIYYFEKMLGDPILLAQKMVTTTPDVSLKTGAIILEFPRNKVRAEKEGAATIKVPVRFLRINDLAVFSAPCELFCEIAMNIKDASPFPETFYFGYSNGSVGYLTTRRAFSEGGYEVRTTSTPFDERAEEIFHNGVLGYINNLYYEK